jgi:beta-lactamase regulating signal transducer with metallopeptidase domain
VMLELLAESALRSIALAGAVWLVLTLLSVRSPQLRMTAWTSVVVASLAMPALTPWMRITLPRVHSHDLVEIAWITPPSAPPAILTVPHGLPQPAADEIPPRETPPETGTGLRVVNVPVVNLRVANLHVLATAVYAVVAGVMMLRLLAGWLLMWRIVRAARPAGNRWAAGAHVRVSDVVRVPVTFASAILLPSSCAEWSERKLQAVMLHEGAHVAHGDSYVLLLAGINRAVFWFNPLAWWLAGHVADLAEMVSDDTAVAGLKDRNGYAETLLDVAGTAQLLPAGLAMARPGAVRRRVARVLAMTAAPERIGVRARAAVAVAMVPLAALSAVTVARGGYPPAVAVQQQARLATPPADAAGPVAAKTDSAARSEDAQAAARRRLAEVADRFRDQTPLAGSKSAVAQMIDDLRRSNPGFERMTPQLVAKMRRQAPVIQGTLQALGATESIFFRGVGIYGLDLYGVKFARGAGEVRIDVAADGTIRDVYFRPEGDGTLGGLTDCTAEAALRAVQGAAPIRLTIINRSGADVSLFSLDAEGQRVAEAVLANNRATDVLTAVERPLIVADLEEQCRDIILPGQLTRMHLIEPPRPGAHRSAMRRNTPVPGSDEVLRQHLEAVRRGDPDYDRMAPDVATVQRDKLSQHEEILSKLGALRAISFRGVGMTGDDIYGLQFANGSAIGNIGFAHDGRIVSLGLGP